jgi:hypothetical protein
MANTVSILSLSSTFGDWFNSTNALAKENNDFAANNFVKPTGTLFLNDPSLGLQVANNSTFGGRFQVQGVGSSAYVQNVLQVDGEIIVNNTQTSIATAGNVTVSKTINALGSNTALYVANTANVAGTLNVNNANIFYLYSNTSSLNVFTANTGTIITVYASSVNTDQLTSNSLTVVNTSTLNNIIANTERVETLSANNISVNNISINNSLTANSLTVNSAITATNTQTVSTFGNLQTTGQLSVGGNFIINGTTVYNSNTFTLNANSIVGQTSTISVYRGNSGANASIRWNETTKYWDLIDVTNSNYYRILTSQQITDNVISTSTSSIASANVANTLNNLIVTNTTSLQNQITSNTISLQNQITSNVNYLTGVNNTQNTNISSVNTLTQSSFNRANTGITSVSGTSGQIYSSGGLTPTLNLIATGVSPGTYGSSSVTPVITVDSYGRLTTVTNTPASIPATQVTGLASSATTDTTNASNITLGTLSASRLATSGVSAGTYTYPNIVVDVAGRITAASSLIPVTSFNTRTGAVTLASSDVTGALGYTPPSTSGSGASGTWGINITGSAASLSGYTINQNLGTGNNVQFNSLGVGTSSSGTSGEIIATNNITAYFSDDKLKTKLGLIESALDKVCTLSGFYYEPNQTAQDLGYKVKREVGLSAQDVQRVLPEVVVPAPIDNQYLTIHYERVIPLLVEAIKELKSEINQLKK